MYLAAGSPHELGAIEPGCASSVLTLFGIVKCVICERWYPSTKPSMLAEQSGSLTVSMGGSLTLVQRGQGAGRLTQRGQVA